MSYFDAGRDLFAAIGVAAVLWAIYLKIQEATRAKSAAKPKMPPTNGDDAPIRVKGGSPVTLTDNRGTDWVDKQQQWEDGWGTAWDVIIVLTDGTQYQSSGDKVEIGVSGSGNPRVAGDKRGEVKVLPKDGFSRAANVLTQSTDGHVTYVKVGTERFPNGNGEFTAGQNADVGLWPK
jgi:hypothetical protein